LRDDSVITSKPTWKLKHANSILETFEYFRQISSKSIHIILRYTVSKLGPFFETQCIVAKRCILEQKLLLRAYRKSYMRNRLVPKWMTLTLFRGHIKVTSTIALHLTLNISETVRDRSLVPKDHQ